MKKTSVRILLMAILVAVSGTAHAISVTWGAQVSYGIANSTGTLLPVGSLVMIGSFGNLTPAQIASANLATLQANFVNLSTTAHRVGEGALISGGPTPTAADAGTWAVNNDTNSSLTLGIAAKPVYYWLFNGTTIANSTQDGIFTASITGASAIIKAQWTFKNDTDVPNTQNTDLGDVLPYTTGRTGVTIDRNSILVGSYGTGMFNGNPLYNLAPINVPEPTTTFLLIGGIALVTLRFRNRRASLFAK